MVGSILQQLDNWFNEPSAQTGDRLLLLSKLALLELCGWLEGEFDRLISQAEVGRLNDAGWVNRNVIKKTNGFNYEPHLRRMFSDVFGEVFARRIEREMERRYPGDLDRLARILLEDLWIKRCNFAHADFAANVAAQRTFDAPSWTRAQHVVVSELIARFESAVIATIATI